MPRRSVIFLAVLLAALLPFLVLVARPFLTSFLLASMICIVVNPMKEWLVVRTQRPVLATALTTFSTVFVVGSVLMLVGFTITRELTTVYEGLDQRSLQEGGWPALVTETADRAFDALATRLPIATAKRCGTNSSIR